MAKLFTENKRCVSILPAVDWQGTNEADKFLSAIGKVTKGSHLKSRKTNREFMEMIQESGHLSILEHILLTLAYPSAKMSNTDELELARSIIDMDRPIFYTQGRIVQNGIPSEDLLIMSGNIRQWKDWLESCPRIFSGAIHNTLSLYYKDYFTSTAIERCHHIRDYKAPKLEGDIPFMRFPGNVCFPVRREAIHNIEILRGRFYYHEDTYYERSSSILDKLVASTIYFYRTERGMTHQLVRHRKPAFTQESTRAVDMSDLQCYIPPSIENNPRAKEKFQIIVDQIEQGYKWMREWGSKKEDARALLPTGTSTNIVVTATHHDWKHIFHERITQAAHYEIRTLMQQAAKYIEEDRRRLNLEPLCKEEQKN